MSDSAADSNVYIHGHDDSVVQQHVRRTAEEAAAFLLPRLHAGMRLLDVGCGPGTITTGLARYVAPGGVVAIDPAGGVLHEARAHARSEQRGDVELSRASVYALPFADASFDVAYAHQVLQHLTAPVDALNEMQRVLKPGACVAVRDADYGTMVAWPKDPRIERFLQIYHQVAERNGADADAGRRIPSWLSAAGFSEIAITTSTWTFTERDAILNWGDSWSERILRSTVGEQALHHGLASQEDLDTIARGWREWAREPDAFFTFVHVEGIGQRPG